MPQWSARGSTAKRTSSEAEQSSLLDAVVAAARFERTGRRSRYPPIQREQGWRGAGVGYAGVPPALAASELRRLTWR